MQSWMEAFTYKSHQSCVWGTLLRHIPDTLESMELLGAVPVEPWPQHCVIFTSHSQLGPSLEYFCHILVLFYLLENTFPQLFCKSPEDAVCTWLIFSPQKSCHEILLDVFGCWHWVTGRFKVLPRGLSKSCWFPQKLQWDSRACLPCCVHRAGCLERLCGLWRAPMAQPCRVKG